MSRRGGSADLLLHGGRVPAWLGQRMTRLGTVICQAIVLEYGRDELLRRLAPPFWFQTRRAFRWLTAARTAIRFRCRPRCWTAPLAC